MIIEKDWHNIDSESQHAIIALGSFDGVHLGHQALLKQAVNFAKQYQKKSAVLTFSPHPATVITPNKQHQLLISVEKKYQLLKELGIDIVFQINFDEAFSRMPAEKFVQDILIKQLKAKHIISGYNFYFGYAKQGDGAMLEKFAQQGSFAYSQIPQVIIDSHPVSSSLIKQYLSCGAVALVEKLLGRAYKISGTVCHGAGQAAKVLEVPTANILLPADCAYPVCGVYYVSVKYAGHDYHGIANLGKRPTFYADAAQLTLEVHIFDLERDIYDEYLEVTFKCLIRPEVQFNDLALLKEQIKRDIAAARYMANQDCFALVKC